MRKTFILLAAGCALSLQAVADRVNSLRAWPAIGLVKPLLTDTLSANGKNIDLDRTLLANRVNLNAERSASTRLEADTAGWFAPRAATGYALHVVQTALKADRFCRLKLTVKSPGRFEVYVNDERKADKQTSQDSLKKAGQAGVTLRMEPEQRYRVVVKLLQTPTGAAPAVALSWTVEGDSTAQVACDPDLKQRVLLAQTASGRSISGQSLSPNGRWLLTTYSDVITPGRSNSYTVLSEVKTGRVLATYTRGSASMGWMPASSRLWYRAPSQGGQALIAVDPETMREERLIDGVREGSVRFAPDEKSFYTTESEQIEGDRGPVHRVLSINDRSGGERGRSFISRYDLGTGLTERLTYGLRSSWLQDVSRDSRKLLISQSTSTPDRWPFRTSTLLLMDAATLHCDTLFSGEPFFDGAAFSPDGRRVLLTGGPEAFGAIGKNCSQPIANDYDKQAFIMDLSTRRIEPISRDFNPSLNLITWNQGDGCIYFNCDDGDRVDVYRYHPDKRSYEKLPLQGDIIRSVSVAARAPYLAYTGSTASHTAIGYLTTTTRPERTLRTFDNAAAQRADIEVGQIKDWQFKAKDGTTVTGYYCLPPDFDASRRYPLIVYYYGGTTPTTRSLSTPYAAQLFASRGYVALMLNPSGTIGYGQEYSARHVNAWGDYTADEIIEGTRRFCAEHASFVDSTRIGCLGASYGGFMTQYLQTKTQLFRCAASHAGISNVTSYWGEGYWGVGYNAVAAARSYPWSNPQLFTEHGSLFNADKIHTPLLLLHGTADTNVPIGESIQLYNALKVLGRTVELVEVDGENHFISDYPKRELWHNTIMAWFARWLQDRPQWWNDLYPNKQLQ